FYAVPQTCPLMLICVFAVSLVIVGCGPSAEKQQRKDLAKAVQRHDTAEVKRLLEAGVDPDEVSVSGGFFGAPFGRRPILHYVADSNSDKAYEILELLLEWGADPNRTSAGATALHRALYNRQSNDLIRLLLDNGADVNARNQSGRTPLEIAVNRGYSDTAALLKSYGAHRGGGRQD
ncbi:MAG: ankyrin repeat domain-containing protein, partial [Armatimonadota bacterium]